MLDGLDGRCDGTLHLGRQSLADCEITRGDGDEPCLRKPPVDVPCQRKQSRGIASVPEPLCPVGRWLEAAAQHPPITRDRRIDEDDAVRPGHPDAMLRQQLVNRFGPHARP